MYDVGFHWQKSKIVFSRQQTSLAAGAQFSAQSRLLLDQFRPSVCP